MLEMYTLKSDFSIREEDLFRKSGAVRSRRRGGEGVFLFPRFLPALFEGRDGSLPCQIRNRSQPTAAEPISSQTGLIFHFRDRRRTAAKITHPCQQSPKCSPFVQKFRSGAWKTEVPQRRSPPPRSVPVSPDGSPKEAL